MALDVASKQGLCMPPRSESGRLKSNIHSFQQSHEPLGMVHDQRSLQVIHTGIKVLWRQAHAFLGQVSHDMDCEIRPDYESLSPSGVCALLKEITTSPSIVVAASASPSSQNGASAVAPERVPTPSSSSTGIMMQVQPRHVAVLAALPPLPLPLNMSASITRSAGAATQCPPQSSISLNPSMTISVTSVNGDVCTIASPPRGARPPVDRSNPQSTTLPASLPDATISSLGRHRGCSTLTVSSHRVQADHAAHIPSLQRVPIPKNRSVLNRCSSERKTGGCCPSCVCAATTFQQYVWLCIICKHAKLIT